MTGKKFITNTAVGLQSEIGTRLARLRLSRNVTQESLAREAGIGPRTLRRLEVGETTGLDTFLRVVIALGLGDDVLAALPANRISPIERIGAAKRERQRARTKHHDSAPSVPWTWGEETYD